MSPEGRSPTYDVRCGMHFLLEIDDQEGALHAPPESEEGHQPVEEEGRLGHDHPQRVDRLLSRLDLLHLQAQDEQRREKDETIIDVEQELVA